MDGNLVISRRPEDEIIAELLAKKFDVITPEKAQEEQRQQEDEEEEEDSSDDPSGNREVARVKSQKGYDYLLNMSVRSLTKEKVRILMQQCVLAFYFIISVKTFTLFSCMTHRCVSSLPKRKRNKKRLKL